MTKQFYERSLRAWMIAFTVMFVIADAFFLFGQSSLWSFFNWQARLLGHPESPGPTGNQWFFLALAHSMMVMITVMSTAIAWKPWRYFEYLPILALSKFTSSLTGLVFYLTARCTDVVCIISGGGLEGARYYSSLIVFLSDFPLGIVALVLYVQGRRFGMTES